MLCIVFTLNTPLPLESYNRDVYSLSAEEAESTAAERDELARQHREAIAAERADLVAANEAYLDKNWRDAAAAKNSL